MRHTNTCAVKLRPFCGVHRPSFLPSLRRIHPTDGKDRWESNKGAWNSGGFPEDPRLQEDTGSSALYVSERAAPRTRLISARKGPGDYFRDAVFHIKYVLKNWTSHVQNCNECVSKASYSTTPERNCLPLHSEVLLNDNHVREMSAWHSGGLIWV